MTDVHVFITSAKVDLSTGESIVLDQEPDGWKLSASPAKSKTASRATARSSAKVEA